MTFDTCSASAAPTENSKPCWRDGTLSIGGMSSKQKPPNKRYATGARSIRLLSRIDARPTASKHQVSCPTHLRLRDVLSTHLLLALLEGPRPTHSAAQAQTPVHRRR